jgi:transposase
VGFVLILAVPRHRAAAAGTGVDPGPGRLARPYCRRNVVNAIRYLTHNGPVWRAVPAVLPHWRTVYHYERTWQETGATRRMHDHLREAVRVLARRDPQPTAAIIDSQSAKAAGTAAKTAAVTTPERKPRAGRGTSLST